MAVENAADVFSGDTIVLDEYGYEMTVLATDKSPTEVRMTVKAGETCPLQFLVFLHDDPVLVVEYAAQ